MNSPVRDAIPAQRCRCGHWARPDEVTECRFCDCKDHRPARAAASAHQGRDPQDPVAAEAALEYFKDEMELARLELADASDAEIDAELARDAARRAWELAEECPKVGAIVNERRITVAYVKAWCNSRITAEEREYRRKKAAREAAAKRLDVLGRQAITQASIAKSVGTGYNLTRGGDYR